MFVLSDHWLLLSPLDVFPCINKFYHNHHNHHDHHHHHHGDHHRHRHGKHHRHRHNHHDHHKEGEIESSTVSNFAPPHESRFRKFNFSAWKETSAEFQAFQEVISWIQWQHGFCIFSGFQFWNSLLWSILYFFHPTLHIFSRSELFPENIYDTGLKAISQILAQLICYSKCRCLSFGVYLDITARDHESRLGIWLLANAFQYLPLKISEKAKFQVELVFLNLVFAKTIF